MLDDRRPDSEPLRGPRQAREPARGRLKIFFGYAAAVGKTYAMLEAARRAKASGIDVVAGYIEPHTRPETMALLEGLEQLPPKTIPCKDTELREFDLDAALKRHPQLLLVDELAHANAEGCRHVKRFQDVQELLRSGINVYTTVNVQDLESLNDKVAAITGVSVAERIPDSVFDSADQVELVDLEPADLLERLREGKIYRPRQAMGNFFTDKNLASLREIALRRTADRLDAAPWFEGDEKPKAGEHILICLSASPSNAKVIRTAARMAKAFHAAFTALFVETPGFANLSEADRRRISANVRLAEELGAKITTTYGDDPAVQIAEYARISGISKVVLGRSLHRDGLRHTKNLVDRLNDLAPDLDIYIIPDQKATRQPLRTPKARPRQERFSAVDLLKMLGVLTLCTLGGGFFFFLGIADTNIIMLYLLGVLVISMVTTGRSYSLLSSVLSVLLFNFFFTDPYFTLRSDPSYIATFGIMLLVALLSSSLTIRVKTQAKMNADKAYRTAILLESSHKLQTAESAEAILTVAAQQLGHLLERDLVVYQADGQGGLLPAMCFPFAGGGDLSSLLTPAEKAVAEWVLKNNKHAGATTNTLPGAQCLYLSIRGTGGALAVVGIFAGQPLQSFEKNLMVALLDECGLALEKELTMREKQKAEAQADQEALRANLLRAISHDLRTPLTSISGNASILMESAEQLEPEKRQSLFTAIYDDAMWLYNLVENLLSITKIEGSRVHMNMEPELLDDIFAEALSHLDRNACKHHIETNLSDDMLMADMDARLMVQVVINIVNNAVKYTPEGSHIILSARRDHSLIVVEIADDGPGIPNEAKGKLFEMFYTAGNERGDGRRGLGLGLSLCKSIVTAHGGTIEAADNHPQGTVFRFTLRASEVTTYE